MSLLARKRGAAKLPDAASILQASPVPTLLLDGSDLITFTNLAAQEFFQLSAAKLVGSALDQVVPADNPIIVLVHQARQAGNWVAEYGVNIETPRISHRIVDVQIAPMSDHPDWTVLTLHPQSMARKIDNQLTHRNAARSVTAMAAMLMHEVKNPLSGIRGASQLLEQTVPDQDRVLTRLITDETDRIIALIDRMEVFSDSRPIDRNPVNIHAVLEHVRMIAQNGFARHVRFVEEYDPSLPAVYGNRDLLVQVFLNLVKNAAEAVPEQGGEIVLSTAYQHGVKLAVAGASSRTHLPLMVSIKDNGAGIPEDMGEHLFDAFVTTKRNGNGLGLAMVAKVVGDHGGVIDFTSRPRKTVFRVYLPMAADPSGEGQAEGMNG